MQLQTCRICASSCSCGAESIRLPFATVYTNITNGPRDTFKGADRNVLHIDALIQNVWDTNARGLSSSDFLAYLAENLKPESLINAWMQRKHYTYHAICESSGQMRFWSEHGSQKPDCVPSSGRVWPENRLTLSDDTTLKGNSRYIVLRPYLPHFPIHLVVGQAKVRTIIDAWKALLSVLQCWYNQLACSSTWHPSSTSEACRATPIPYVHFQPAAASTPMLP